MHFETQPMSDKLLPTSKPPQSGQQQSRPHFLRPAEPAGESAMDYFKKARDQLTNGEVELAAMSLEKAIGIDPKFHEAWGLLGQLMLDHGEVISALECFASAASAAPQETYYKEMVVELLRHTKYVKFNAKMKGLILDCLQTPQLPCVKLLRPWLNILKADPEFKKLFKVKNEAGRPVFNKNAFDRAKDYAALLDPYFISGLYKLLVTDIHFEQFLTHLRRFLLDEIDAENPHFTPEEYTKLAAAIGAYCSFNEYIFDYTEEEESIYMELAKRVENDSDLAADTRYVALLGCYMPLYKLRNAKHIAELNREDSQLSGMIRRQLDDYFSLRDTAATITPITEISDEVSKMVQEQYEEQPYPKWRDFSKLIYEPEIEADIQHDELEILNAGCGTGHEAIELGWVFSNANVLAVDLSLNSLAFAKQKAQEHEVKNITFHQADILNLRQLERKFDYVSSGGVIHHMKDPEAGLEVLADVLEDGGILRLGLYSRIAREPINEAREAIRDAGLTHSVDDIRRFRREAEDLVGKDTIDLVYRSSDYYAMPTCRDLLFHVQEHQFTLLQIKDMLERHNLEFLKFHHAQEVFDKYTKMFPDDPDCTNLVNWHKFEEKHRMTFIRMYMFYCRKKAS